MQTQNKHACFFSFFFFFYLAPAAPTPPSPLPPAPALKGLTSLCGSRSLSCTDLINNFYQPLAQGISRGWAGEGMRWGRAQPGRGVVARGGEGWGRRGVGKGLSITFQQHETRAYIMIRGCSHDHKRPIGEYLRVREEPPQHRFIAW